MMPATRSGTEADGNRAPGRPEVPRELLGGCARTGIIHHRTDAEGCIAS